ncbi:MAG: hypothetical protein AW10_01683 [Candidatus Accumulibacter appositus]|uniref:Uncharacterized protein n=1 Tax=Candidatus Accumulibacter appositus TaxID=1454003 RepID=A0A011NZH7_9PROT|nr:MAG: hypothetical protein AW10_01683 [Candidatus Accumulibacter appositus]
MAAARRRSGHRWRRRRAGLEAFDDLFLDTPGEQLFDCRQQRPLFGTNQRQRFAGTAGTASAADAMHVVFGNVRQLEVHHVRQLFDVQAAGGDVGGHQYAHRAVLETGQGARARRLALVAVDRGGFDAGLAQILGEAVGAALHAREHQYLLPVARRHQMHQQVALAPAIDRVNTLRDEFGLGVAACDFDHRRVV